MQNTNNPPPTQNTVTEIAMPTVAVLLVLAGVILLYLGTIDIAFAAFLFVSALGLLGYNTALKAPSPAQQAQLSAQLQSAHQIASQAMAVLPMFANHTHAPANVAVSVPQVQAQPTAPTAVVRQPAQVAPQVAQPAPMQQLAQAMPVPLPLSPPLPQAAIVGQQFRPPVFTPLPDISMPMAAMPPVQQAPTQS